MDSTNNGHSPVTYDDVANACRYLLAAQKGVARPKVQLELERTIGHKGSNSVVQSYINEFWSKVAAAAVGNSVRNPDLTVEQEAIVNGAMRQLVQIAQQLARAELADQRSALDKIEAQARQDVQSAMDTVVATEQLRVRAEGELSACQETVALLRASVATLEKTIASAMADNDRLSTKIEERDDKLRQANTELLAASERLTAANAGHINEVRRLMKQVDDERQSAKTERLTADKTIQGLRDDLERSRKELGSSREETAVLRTELSGVRTTLATLQGVNTGLQTQIAEMQANLDTTQTESTAMKIRLENAEARRAELEARERQNRLDRRLKKRRSTRLLRVIVARKMRACEYQNQPESSTLRP